MCFQVRCVCIVCVWMHTPADMFPELLAPAGPVWGISGGVSEIEGEEPKWGKGGRVKGGSEMVDSVNK